LCAPDVAGRVGACAGGRGSVGDRSGVGDGGGHGAIDAERYSGLGVVGRTSRATGDATRDGLSLFRDIFLSAADTGGDCCQSRAWGGRDGDSDSSTSSFFFFLFSRFYWHWRRRDIGGSLGRGDDGSLAVRTCGVGGKERFTSLRGFDSNGDSLLLVRQGGSGGRAFCGFDYGGTLVGGIRGLERLVAGGAVLVVVIDII